MLRGSIAVVLLFVCCADTLTKQSLLKTLMDWSLYVVYARDRSTEFPVRCQALCHTATAGLKIVCDNDERVQHTRKHQEGQTYRAFSPHAAIATIATRPIKFNRVHQGAPQGTAGLQPRLRTQDPHLASGTRCTLALMHRTVHVTAIQRHWYSKTRSAPRQPPLLSS